MKKITAFLLSVICIVFVFSSCNSEQNTEPINPQTSFNPFDAMSNQSDENNILNAEFSFGTAVQKLEYTGTDLEFEYEIENGTVECEIGIMVVIDGIPQKYKTNTNNIESYVHSFKMNKNHTEKFKISIHPSVGKTGETLYLNTLSILNPSFSPNPENIEYANNLKISEAGYIPVEFSCDAQTEALHSQQATITKDIPEEIIKEIEEAGGNIANGTDPYLYFDSLNSDGTKILKLDKNGQQKLTLNGFGGPSNKYRIFIFNNNTAVPFANGASYIDINYLPDKLTTISVEISNKALSSGSSLYAVAFPIIENTNVINTVVHPVQTSIYYVQ